MKNIQEKSPEGEVVIYQPSKGGPQVQLTLQEETLWMSLDQIANLFDRNKSSISRHFHNIFKSKELARVSVVAKIATTADDTKVYQVEYYNLDAIISVGYRVNSKKGTQFRIWAAGILKEHLVSGFSLNKKVMAKNQNRFEDLKSAVALLQRATHASKLTSEEVGSVVDVIHDFAHALEVLDGYDHASLEITGTTRRKVKPISYKEAMEAIAELGIQYQSSALFGRKRMLPSSAPLPLSIRPLGGMSCIRPSRKRPPTSCISRSKTTPSWMAISGLPTMPWSPYVSW